MHRLARFAWRVASAPTTSSSPRPPTAAETTNRFQLRVRPPPEPQKAATISEQTRLTGYFRTAAPTRLRIRYPRSRFMPIRRETASVGTSVADASIRSPTTPRDAGHANRCQPDLNHRPAVKNCSQHQAIRARCTNLARKPTPRARTNHRSSTPNRRRPGDASGGVRTAAFRSRRVPAILKNPIRPGATGAPLTLTKKELRSLIRKPSTCSGVPF